PQRGEGSASGAGPLRRHLRRTGAVLEERADLRSGAGQRPHRADHRGRWAPGWRHGRPRQASADRVVQHGIQRSLRTRRPVHRRRPVREARLGQLPVQAPMTDARAYRLSDIDMLRGLVIVIMAIDHTRDYLLAGTVQDPASNPNVSTAIFFTRWITHFCAPAFVFLAGTSAGLMAGRRSPSWLGAFLLKRGIWLIVVEVVLISTAWSFAPLGVEQLGGLIPIPMQVIWAIGASMVVLAGAQFLGHRACLVIGLAIVFGHNLLDLVWPQTSAPP